MALMGVIVALALAFRNVSSGHSSNCAKWNRKAAFTSYSPDAVDCAKDASSPITYCTIGEDPFQGSLDAILGGKMMGNRPFRVLHFKQPQEIQHCQALFVGGAEKKILPAIIADVQGNSVLTVGESEHFIREGGMIGFCLEENRVRFEVNLETAQKKDCESVPDCWHLQRQ